ncbi:MAG: hypothetical protein HUU19_09495 [Phycisphaerales bacterium]|nr:hypothetical protein [Phycisphaerales bacterium]
MSASPARLALVLLGAVIIASSAYSAWNMFWASAGVSAVSENWRDLPQTIDDIKWTSQYPGRPKPSGDDWLAKEVHGYIGPRFASNMAAASLSGLCGVLIVIVSVFIKAPNQTPAPGGVVKRLA